MPDRLAATPDTTAEERRRLEDLLALLQTLGALCHKVNNPLTSLLGRAQLLKMRVGDDDYLQSSCEVIEESSQRIADTIQELAEVVRKNRKETLQALEDREEAEDV
jgi:signal transduction histidine kinase